MTYSAPSIAVSVRERFCRFCQQTVVALLLLFVVATQLAFAADEVPLPGLTEIRVTSSLDGTQQPLLYWAPETADSQPAPVLVFLHSWSGNYRQKNDAWQRQAVERGWIYLHPDFRGRNDTPQACGSKFARQDILDAVDFATEKFRVDRQRIYLAGTSGGGHMSMLMAGHHPDRFSAVSAWVGISDLAAWYRFHVKDGEPQNYARMILKSLGGPPSEDAGRDAEYRDRSPLFHLHRTASLPIELAAGIRDGHSGSVPVSHTLLAWSEITKARSGEPVSAADIEWIGKLGGQSKLLESELAKLPVDMSLGRKILLRRVAGDSRVTIFDGGHEGIAAAACDWLDAQRRLAE
ncbi:prolyl oligopeptidase family serine peptidase [bacterium]|nr:prolyl oligopeptidase family serine peptidase [bacterium]